MKDLEQPVEATASMQAPKSIWQPISEGQTERATRATVLTIALLLLAGACITAFVSALRIASIWFEPRFVPIVHLLVAGAVIALCVAVVRRIKRPA